MPIRDQMKQEKTEREFKRMIKSFRHFEKERIGCMMKLNLENQLRKIVSQEMEIKVIKLRRDTNTPYEEMQPYRFQAGKDY